MIKKSSGEIVNVLDMKSHFFPKWRLKGLKNCLTSSRYLNKIYQGQVGSLMKPADSYLKWWSTVVPLSYLTGKSAFQHKGNVRSELSWTKPGEEYLICEFKRKESKAILNIHPIPMNNCEQYSQLQWDFHIFHLGGMCTSYHCQKSLELSFLPSHAHWAADLHILHWWPLCDISYWKFGKK